MSTTIVAQIKAMVAKAAGVAESEVHLEHPELEKFGDFSTNIAIAKKLNANDIAAKIPGATVAGPGFINIRLTNEQLTGLLTNDFQFSPKDTLALIEYSSPNIARPFGIGHLRSTIFGQALYNIYTFLGYQTVGDNHLGDWGTQFGKLIYMIQKDQVSDFTIENLEKLYVEFHEHPEWEAEGRMWFKKLEDGDKEARTIWQKCVEVSLAEFNRIYDLLGIKIDNAHGESFYEDLMKDVVKDAEKVAKKSDGALIIEIPGQKTPLMLLKSDGGTTYATRDLATLKFRKQKWNPKIIVYEVGAEQTLYFIQLFSAAKILGYVTDENILVHTKHGLYLDTDGKRFRTRKGKTIKLDEVLAEAIELAKKFNPDEKTAKSVGIGAVKYFDLSHNIQSDIIFDWDKIMALEGNSGPYLQYTYARTQSVLAKVQSSEFMVNRSSSMNNELTNYELNSEELSILRWIYRFPEVIEEAAGRFAPNLLCNFLYELAQRFNTFYNKHSILEPESGRVEEREFRLAMTARVGEVLKKGLNLLGIEAPEKM